LGSVPALDLRWRSGPDAAALIDLLYLALDDLEPLAIHDHETADGWRVFFKSSAQRDVAASALHAALASRGLSIEPTDIADENWAKRSQEALRAIRIGRLIVAPPWDATDTGSAADNTDNTEDQNPSVLSVFSVAKPTLSVVVAKPTLSVVIEPSTGFGTGHHETTRLCLELLQTLNLDGRRVIDVGTGSGVLAIAAAKLGASTVVAFDDDPQALENARENVERNAVSSRVSVRELDLGSPTLDLAPAAVVLANLTSGVLLKFAHRLDDLVERDGVLLISGFAPDDLAELVDTFAPIDVQSRTDGAWAAALLRFRNPRATR
jgi:ribosomal protein L11 methylase PrmA